MATMRTVVAAIVLLVLGCSGAGPAGPAPECVPTDDPLTPEVWCQYDDGGSRGVLCFGDGGFTFAQCSATGAVLPCPDGVQPDCAF